MNQDNNMNTMNNVVGNQINPQIMPNINTNIAPTPMPVTPNIEVPNPVQTNVMTNCPYCGAPKIGKYCTQCGKQLDM